MCLQEPVSSQDKRVFLKGFIDPFERFHSPFTYWSFFLFSVRFLLAERIGYTFGWHYHTTDLNSLGHCIYVHQGRILCAAGLEPQAPSQPPLPMSYPGATKIF